MDLLDSALAAQGLTAADVDANRAGRVSPTQLARVDRVQSSGRVALALTLGPFSLLGVGLAAYHYVEHGEPLIFVLPALTLGLCAAIYLLVVRFNRLPMPAEIADAKVTVVRAKVSRSRVAGNRDVYDVWLDGVRYAGCSNALSDEVREEGRRVDAFVVAERKLVVALVPVE